jgi:Holliday junction resolvase RusA-like endonuclease
MDQLKLAASEAMMARPMLEGPLRITMLAEMPIPKTFSKKKREAAILMEILPTVRPDLKNLLWLAEDAIKSVVYADDSIICEHRNRKIYSEKPRLVLTIERIGQPLASPYFQSKV